MLKAFVCTSSGLRRCVYECFIFWVYIMKFKSVIGYFSKGELILWISSMTITIIAFIAFDGKNFISLIASLIGATSLIFNAKGNPFGQLLMILFSLIYGIISFSFSYFGEMLTYLGMTMPMAVFSLISWLKNPYKGNKSEVAVNKLKSKDYIVMTALSIAVTFVFYFFLDYFNTANIIPSTISVTTSFIAVYLTFRRSPYYAIGYAANDIVLIVLWIMASAKNMSYISVVFCFVTFLANDIYGFISWKKMEKRQCNGE